MITSASAGTWRVSIPVEIDGFAAESLGDLAGPLGAAASGAGAGAGFFSGAVFVGAGVGSLAAGADSVTTQQQGS